MLAITACGGRGSSGDTSAADARDEPRVFAATVIPTAVAAAQPVASPQLGAAAPAFRIPDEHAQLARLVIPAARVNAPFQVKGVNARNEMETPDGKDNVAWYGFTARPGFGSNAVFSGHVDWYTGEQGVFWHLRDLKKGDEVTIRLSDGSELQYRVTHNDVWSTSDAPVAEIIGPTRDDTVTLITCDGTFNRRSQEYDQRRVVRAERVS